MNINQEQKYFESIREHLVKTNNGMFAVIKGYDLLGCYPSIMEAYKAGSESYSTGEPFMIKMVLKKYPVTSEVIVVSAKNYADWFKN